MDNFDNNFNSDNNQPKPDYYQPVNNNSNSGTYYTPPQSEKPPVENNTTYHYAYNPVHHDDYSQNTFNTENNNDNKPPKKNNTAKIIVAVLAVCLIAAIVCIVLNVTGVIGENDSTGKQESTTQVESGDSAKLADSEDVPLKDSGNNYTVAGVAKEAMDSCVGITVFSQQADAYNFFYGQGNGGSGSEAKSGEGSGVLMSEQNGKTYVLTCAHVISEGDSFSVTLNDGKEVEAKMVGFDSQTDIGVLSIEETGLKIAEFADSAKLVVGEQVVAIGCPGGLEFMNSVTSGYISALDRPVSSQIGYDNECIQTDAAINPGNSGGALFNMQGQVIGINSSKIASTEYEGMGFAVPTSTAIATANSLIKVGYVEGRAKIGIQYSPITSFSNYSQVLRELEAKGFKDAQGTMVISSVDESSDLANKDIKKYDMIVAVNGETLTSTDVMTSVLSDSKPGDTIKLTMARIENQQIKTFEVECELIESKG